MCAIQVFKFLILSIENQQCAFFLSIEQEYIHKQSYSLGRGHINISFANKSETDSNVFDLTNYTTDVLSIFEVKISFCSIFLDCTF